MGLVQGIVQKLSSKEIDLVWIEGFGDVVSIIGGENWQKFIRQPVQVERSKVPQGIKILDAKTLKLYNDAIKAVEHKCNKIKAKEAIDPNQ